MIDTTSSTTGSDQTFRRISLRLIPFIILLYFICYIDRTNIGFAKLQFLDDLGLTNAHYGLAAGLFYVTYAAFDMPSTALLHRVGVRKTLLRIMVLWGVVSGAQMLIRNEVDLYLLRLLFGAAEAGFIPCVMLYLTFWFPMRYRARISSLFFAAVPLSAIVGGPLSGLIMNNMDGALGWRGWQWLFLLFAIPAIVLGIVAYLYLDDDPASARWLSAREKAVVSAEITRDHGQGASGAAADSSGFFSVFRDPRIYVLAVLNFAANAASNTATFWLPTVLEQAGLDDISLLGWISGGISLVAVVAMLLIARHSDRIMERRWHYVCCALLTAVSYCLLPLAATSLPFTIVLMAGAATGGIGLLAIYWTMPTSYLHGRAAAGGIGFVSMVGAIGSAVSPSLIGWLQSVSGSLYVGLLSTTVITIIGAALLLATVPRDALAPAGDPT